MNFVRASTIAFTRRLHTTSIARLPVQSKFPAVPEYRVFPASLIRLTTGHRANLWPVGSEGVRSREDMVLVSEDGFVRQNIGTLSNGAVFRPNTHSMQELMRMMVDQYLEDEDSCSADEIPTVFTVAKGTQVPDALILLREEPARFSIQPRQPLTLFALNEAILEFHRKCSKVQTADEWLDGHEYGDAFTDDEKEAWMAV